MRAATEHEAIPKSETAESSAGNDVTITVTGNSEEALVIDAVHFSYDAEPTGARLRIGDGTSIYTTIWDVDITGTVLSPQEMIWPRGLQCTKGNNFKVTLFGGGGSVVGKVNVSYR